MQYPNITQYKQAIIEPDSFATINTDITPVFDGKDLVMASGNFACVFKMQHKGMYHALKCFTKDIDERTERQKKIVEYIKNNPSPYFIDYEYLENELWIDINGGMEVPVSWMEWIEAPTLGQKIKEYCDAVDKEGLRLLTEKFREFALWIIGQPFAHGDLKHDNLLVKADGSLIMVDYDGMFIPEFEGKNALELGSKCYQHPIRNENHFDRNIDDFSILIIYTSLLALYEHPSLYEIYNNGQNIIFDFTEQNKKSNSELLYVISSFNGLNKKISYLYEVLDSVAISLNDIAYALEEENIEDKLLTNLSSFEYRDNSAFIKVFEEYIYFEKQSFNTELFDSIEKEDQLCLNYNLNGNNEISLYHRGKLFYTFQSEMSKSITILFNRDVKMKVYVDEINNIFNEKYVFKIGLLIKIESEFKNQNNNQQLLEELTGYSIPVYGVREVNVENSILTDATVFKHYFIPSHNWHFYQIKIYEGQLIRKKKTLASTLETELNKISVITLKYNTKKIGNVSLHYKEHELVTLRGPIKEAITNLVLSGVRIRASITNRAAGNDEIVLSYQLLLTVERDNNNLITLEWWNSLSEPWKKLLATNVMCYGKSYKDYKDYRNQKSIYYKGDLLIDYKTLDYKVLLEEIKCLKELTYDGKLFDIDLFTPLLVLRHIRVLKVYNNKADLTVLQKMTNLERLDINEDVNWDTIETTAKLSQLRELNINTEGWNMDMLSNLTNLRVLNLYTGGGSIKFVSKLTKLEKIIIETYYERIYDKDAMAGLTNLKELKIYNDVVNDLAFLGHLNKLEVLRLYIAYDLEDLSLLSKLINIRQLELKFDSGSEADITFISNLTQLEVLDLDLHNLKRNEKTIDISFLSKLTNLKQLKITFGRDRDIINSTVFLNLSNLEDLSLDLSFSNCNLASLASMKSLNKIKIKYVNSNDLAPINDYLATVEANGGTVEI